MAAAAARATLRRRPGRQTSRPPLSLAVPAVLAAGLVVLPLAVTVLEATQVDLSDAMDLLIRPLVGELLSNTMALVFVTTLLSAVIGTAAAWVVERSDLPGRRVWGVLAAVPLAIPPFITSFAWVSLSNDLQDFAGACLVVTCAYYPLIYLPVGAALRELDPALEESARSLGLGPWRCFLRVVLPQLRPALFGGMLLVALNTLVEFGAFALLHFRTFTTQLYAQYRTGLDGPESSLLAVVLILLCLLCLAAERMARGRTRYARIGGGTRKPRTRAPLRWMAVPVLAGFAALIVATLGVPIGMIVFWLLQHAEAATSPVAPSLALLTDASMASVEYGAAGALTALVLAMPLAYLATRFPGRWVLVLERIAYLGQGVPGIVVALALISLAVETMQPLYQSALLLIATYGILFLPLALVSLRASLAQVQRGLEEAGRSLGLGWFAVFCRVLVPLIAPGIGAALALVFVSVVTELTATLLLSPIGTRTLATQVWANTSALAFAAAAPFAAVMLLLSLLSTWVLARRFGAGALAARG